MSTEDKSIQESSPAPISALEDDSVFDKVEAKAAETSAPNPVEASDLQNRDSSKEGFFGRIIKALSPRSKKTTKDSSSSGGPTAEEAPACEKSSEEKCPEDGKLMTEVVEEPTDEGKEIAAKDQAEAEAKPSAHEESLNRKASTGSFSDTVGKLLSIFKRLKVNSSSGSAPEDGEEKSEKVSGSEDVKLDQNDAVEKPQEVPGCADDEPLIKKEESAEDTQASKQMAQ